MITRIDKNSLNLLKINTHDAFVTALYGFLQINDELKITSTENKSIHRNQSNSDNFPMKKNKKPPCSVCKAGHPTFRCSKLSALKYVQSKTYFLISA